MAQIPASQQRGVVHRWTDSAGYLQPTGTEGCRFLTLVLIWLRQVGRLQPAERSQLRRQACQRRACEARQPEESTCPGLLGMLGTCLQPCFDFRVHHCQLQECVAEQLPLFTPSILVKNGVLRSHLRLLLVAPEGHIKAMQYYGKYLP
eukprot:6182289-Pleurochrysis_carterae.AAC.1